jgi:hypothetical protein
MIYSSEMTLLLLGEISFLFHLKISVHLCNKFFFSTPKKVLKEKETRDLEQLQ